MTLLDHLVSVLSQAHLTNTDAGVKPACVLWPDGDRHWESIIPQLRAELPQLYSFGEYAPDDKQGPAAWLRCAIAGTVDVPTIEETPILYLPGVTRAMLRGGDNCDPVHQPLVELQYRGVYWSQESSRDWTPMAILGNKKTGLSAEVKRDVPTKEALAHSLPKLIDCSVTELRGKLIDAPFLRKLLAGSDIVRQLLNWIDQGDKYASSRAPEIWNAFQAEVKDIYGFDAQKKGHLGAVLKLGACEGRWKEVFDRYAEAPLNNPNIIAHLRKAQLSKDIFWLDESGKYDGWPQWNDDNEAALLISLKELTGKAPELVRASLQKEEERHCNRRELIWCSLGEAPLAQALEHLNVLARLSAKPLPATSPEVLAKAYRKEGYLTDDAVLRALACVKDTEQREVVVEIIRALYEPWAQQNARTLQKLVSEGAAYPGPTLKTSNKNPSSWPASTCIFFVDGLRYDVGVRLREKLLESKQSVDSGTAVWSALPSVTATAKPAVSPIAYRIDADRPNKDFEPQLRGTDKAVNSSKFKSLLKAEGWEVLKGSDTGNSSGFAWTETKEIDDEGHKNKVDFASGIDRYLDSIVRRVGDLIAAGWSNVRIVTDHGWLYLPNGLPKEELDQLLTDSRWGRNAQVKEGVDRSDFNQVAWSWNPLSHFVVPSGINCFRAGQAYSHGGLSLQECLTLHLHVTGSEISSVRLTLKESWIRQRCTIVVDGDSTGCKFDIRREPNDANSTVIPSPKSLGEDGTASAIVSEVDFAEEQPSLYLVLLDASGEVRAQTITKPV